MDRKMARYGLNMAKFGLHVLALLLVAAAPALADWSGPFEVHDGDGLVVGGLELRLSGIDAPELSQACHRNGEAWYAGCAARDAVAQMLRGRSVLCRDLGPRTYGRPVVDCTIDGEDLLEAIVRAGWAFDYVQFSKTRDLPNGRYFDAEREAREAGRGMWQGQCEKPWDWRARQPRGWWKQNRCPLDPPK